MAANTGVDWATHSHPVIVGCSLESPGCIHCYAIRDAWRMAHHPDPRISGKYEGLVEKLPNGKLAWTGKVRFHEASLLQPLRWRKPGRIFLTPEGDIAHPEVSDDIMDRVLAVAALAHWHDWIIVTKRSARLSMYFLDPKTPRRIASALIKLAIEHNLASDKRLDRGLARVHLGGLGLYPWPLPNFWLVSSIERQKEADLRREPMRRLAEAGWITGVSYEPALERIDLAGWEFLTWLVDGGESGPNARISPSEVFRIARQFCAVHGIAYNHKQNGAWIDTGQIAGAELGRLRLIRGTGEEYRAGFADPEGRPLFNGRRFLIRRHAEDRRLYARMGKGLSGRRLDGMLHDAYPAQAQTTPAAELAEAGA